MSNLFSTFFFTEMPIVIRFRFNLTLSFIQLLFKVIRTKFIFHVISLLLIQHPIYFSTSIINKLTNIFRPHIFINFYFIINILLIKRWRWITTWSKVHLNWFSYHLVFLCGRLHVRRCIKIRVRSDLGLNALNLSK